MKTTATSGADENNRSSKVFSVRVCCELANRIHDSALARGLSPSRLLSLMLDDYFNEQARIDFVSTLVDFEKHRADRDEQLIDQFNELGKRLDGLEALMRQALFVD